MEGSAGSPAPPRFELLGPLRAWRGADELDLGTAKQRAVLIMLLINANRPVAVSTIVEAVWQGEPPENGANVVQKYVAGLRRVLEPDRSPRSPGQLLTLSEAGYRLAVDPYRLDSERFEQYVRAARSARADGRLTDAIQPLREALDLYRGVPLAGLSGPVFDAARDRFTEARAAALELWADLELQCGNHAQLVTRLTELVGEFPFREQPRYLLILALYRCGRQAEALAAFRDTRQLLADEFGVEPGERLQELHRGILRSDPVLLADVTPPALVNAGTATGWPPPSAGPRLAEPAPVVDVIAPRVPSPRVSSTLPVEAGPPPAPTAPAPPSGTGPPDRPTSKPFPSWLTRTISIVVPLITCGLASWAMVGYYAARNRSRTLAWVAAAYLGLIVYFGFAIDLDHQPKAGPWASSAMIALVCSTLGGAAHGLLLASSRPAAGWPDPDAWAAAARHARREQARELVHGHPAIARELHIGRPDLPRTFDDGGLVDVNSAPEAVLAKVPGLPPGLAQRIVADRTTLGHVSSVDDVIRRHLVPHQLAATLRECLVAVPPS